MKITATAPGFSPIILGDDDDAEPISGLLPQWESQIQVAPRLRADKVSVFNRKNAQITFPWRVVREHETTSDAMAFILTHVDDIPEQALVEIRHRTSTGRLVTRWMPDAFLRPVRCVEHFGICTVWQYQAIGAEFLATKPI